MINIIIYDALFCGYTAKIQVLMNVRIFIWHNDYCYIVIYHLYVYQHPVIDATTVSSKNRILLTLLFTAAFS